MVLKNKRIGVAMTGSFCTYTKAFEQIDRLLEEGAILQRSFLTYPSISNAGLEKVRNL